MGRAALFALACCLIPRAGSATPPAFPGLATVTVTSPDTDVPIADASSLTSLLTVSGVSGVVVDVDVSLNLTHPSANQLDLYLVSPRGTTVTLSTDNGGANADVFAGTVFDDQAPGTPSAPNVRNFVYTTGVPTGAIQPEEALGKLVGEPANGPWVLVVSDDTGGLSGILHSWSLTITTLGAVHPAAPLSFPGSGGQIPDNNTTGRSSSVVVSGAGRYLYHAGVTVDAPHPRAGDLSFFLTAPSGKRIDLMTNFGGGNVDLWAGTTFDDQAGMPASDETLPASGTPFGTVAGEGALAAFLGDNPNGTWTLTAVDNRAGNVGTLNGWTLHIVTASVCGDGVVDPGEQCDDGNRVEGDGCDSNCTPTACGNGIVDPGEDCDDGNTVNGDGCSSTCHTSESDCGNCVDDDGNGLVDAMDPACPASPLTLQSGTIARAPGRPRGTVRLRGTLAMPSAPAGPVEVLLTDANGAVFCGKVGALHGPSRARTAHGRVAGGTFTVKLTGRSGGTVAITGRNVDLSGLDQPALTLGVQLGSDRFVTGATFHSRGPRRWVFP